MKIYTKGGDDGTTGLFGGKRTCKSDLRIACIGEIDELNAALGWAAVTCDFLREALHAVQNDLFNLGAELATPTGIPPAKLNPASTTRLEQQIDAAETKLPELKNFILPGGSEPAARLHLARAICRRAERALVAFGQSDPQAVIYINRLSDWLFVQARRANQIAAIADVAWTKE